MDPDGLCRRLFARSACPYIKTTTVQGAFDLMSFEGAVPERKFLMAAHLIRREKFTCNICENYVVAVDVETTHFTGRDCDADGDGVSR